jgi:hypothetical protein
VALFYNGRPLNDVDSTSAGPAACFINNLDIGQTSYLYLFWKANDPSNRIYYSRSTNGVTWQPGQTINDVDSTSAAPSCLSNYTTLMWKENYSWFGFDFNRIFWSNSAFGEVWDPGTPINGVDSTSAAPAAF